MFFGSPLILRPNRNKAIPAMRTTVISRVLGEALPLGMRRLAAITTTPPATMRRAPTSDYRHARSAALALHGEDDPNPRSIARRGTPPTARDSHLLAVRHVVRGDRVAHQDRALGAQVRERAGQSRRLRRRIDPVLEPDAERLGARNHGSRPTPYATSAKPSSSGRSTVAAASMIDFGLEQTSSIGVRASSSRSADTSPSPGCTPPDFAGRSRPSWPRVRRGGGLALRVGYEVALKMGADWS